MRLWILALSVTMSLAAAERWRMQFFHDEDREQIQFSAIAFCSPARGIADWHADEGRRPLSKAYRSGYVEWWAELDSDRDQGSRACAVFLRRDIRLDADRIGNLVHG
jgi:hypothetical protein